MELRKKERKKKDPFDVEHDFFLVNWSSFRPAAAAAALALLFALSAPRVMCVTVSQRTYVLDVFLEFLNPPPPPLLLLSN